MSMTGPDRVADALERNQAARAALLHRKLVKLARPRIALRRAADGTWRASQNADGRRRVLAVFSDGEIRELCRDGALGPRATTTGAIGIREKQDAPDEVLVLTEAGFSRVRRGPDGDFAAQSAPRLREKLQGPDGVWVEVERRADARARFEGTLSRSEAEAAARLSADHSRAEAGPRLCAAWDAPPIARAERGPGSGPGMREAAAYDARRRVEAAFRALGPDLGAIVRAFVIEEAGLSELERRFQWPPRSGRIGVRLALQALALHYAGGSRDLRSDEEPR